MNYPWGRLNYYEKEKKFGAQFTVDHEIVTIAGFKRQDEKYTWNIGGIQNINRTDEARKIREKLSNGIKLHWYKVQKIFTRKNQGSMDNYRLIGPLSSLRTVHINI